MAHQLLRDLPPQQSAGFPSEGFSAGAGEAWTSCPNLSTWRLSKLAAKNMLQAERATQGMHMTSWQVAQ